MAKLLNKKTILEAADIKSEKVACPEWGGDVMVYGLMGREKDRFEESLINQSGRKTRLTLADATARLCVLCIRDENGKRLFSDDEVAALSKKSNAPLARIYDAAEKLSGMKKGDLEEMVKNSETIRKNDSD